MYCVTEVCRLWMHLSVDQEQQLFSIYADIYGGLTKLKLRVWIIHGSEDADREVHFCYIQLPVVRATETYTECSQKSSPLDFLPISLKRLFSILVHIPIWLGLHAKPNLGDFYK